MMKGFAQFVASMAVLFFVTWLGETAATEGIRAGWLSPKPHHYVFAGVFACLIWEAARRMMGMDE